MTPIQTIILLHPFAFNIAQSHRSKIVFPIALAPMMFFTDTALAVSTIFLHDLLILFLMMFDLLDIEFHLIPIFFNFPLELFPLSHRLNRIILFF